MAVDEPQTQAERRHETGGASSIFSGGKTGKEKSTRKWSIIGAVAGVIGIFLVIYLYERNKAAAAAAGGAAPTVGVPQGALQPSSGGYVAGSGAGDIGGNIDALTSAVNQLGSELQTVGSYTSPPQAGSPSGAQTAPRPGTITTQPNTGTPHQMLPSNPWAPGQIVGKGEKIAPSDVYAPGYGWVDATTLGGLYTSQGFSVSGSAYSPSYSGAPPSLRLVNSNQVAEYQGSKLLGTYTLRKAG